MTQYWHGDKWHANADDPLDHAAKHERDNDPEYFGQIERLKAGAENAVSEIDLSRRKNEGYLGRYAT
ncbi:hypothetical protein [Caballeronia udeis]|uniref:hypothetical protein n=1 Tax=Caballeronia udeis TaxID=1232866 RepID=UPI00384DA6FF